MDFPESTPYSAGDVVYLFYRNPHTQNVASIQQAQVVDDPQNEGELALFLYDTFYPLSNEFVLFKTEEEAESLYNEYFGPTYS
ncbi:MAG: transcriptional regulator [Bacillaceae bacterium]|nr:transcriptional regulator [Bacillaceae bacterium]